MQRWIEVADDVRITGDGMAWIPSERALVVADVHLGYDLAARRRGGFLPRIASGAAIARQFVAVAASLAAERLIVAGDLRHSTRDVDDLERREIAAFAGVVRSALALDVVRGNHDAGDALVGGSMTSVRIGPVDVVHEPPATLPERFVVCGHLHPRVTLRDETGAGGRYRCALACESILILPAASEWAGGVEAARLVRDLPRARWRALPVHDGLVADVGLAFTTNSED